MFRRALVPTARILAQQPAMPIRVALAAPRLPSHTTTISPAFALAQRRMYANQPSGTSESGGKPVTSTSHPTVPKTPPKPTAFFARKNIGLEVTPLMAFIGTIVTVAIGFLIHAVVTDDDIQHRHGVPVDDKLKKVIGEESADHYKK